jgi:glycosyltransferase involved in cell wall biosynthesis
MNNTFNPKVSIIIPVYNSGKYLRRCLASVCSQTLQEIEIICINDGSTDNSPDILREFAKRDSRVIIIDQENSGVAAARNRGMRTANALFIGFVDSDDFIAPDMYFKMYNAMIMNDVDFIECGSVIIDIYACNSTDQRDVYLSNLLSGRIDDPETFTGTAHELWKTLFKKELIIRERLSFTDGFNSYEDCLFIYSYKSVSQSGFYIPEIMYIHFYYENSIMGMTFAGKQGQRVTDLLEMINLYYLFLQTHGAFERLRNVFWGYFITKIEEFYKWAEPDVIKTHGIAMIRELLNNKDILKLAEEKNKAYLKFIKIDEKKLMNLLFLDNWSKRTIRKMIKYILPYGIVRHIQKKSLI